MTRLDDTTDYVKPDGRSSAISSPRQVDRNDLRRGDGANVN
jgi:hypothetical protein